MNTKNPPRNNHLDSSNSSRDIANAIRALSIDAIEKATSGHPGMPMGMADVATVLFSKYLKFNPKDPQWPDRDRFILSAGHGSMLLYSLGYLTGYDLSLDEIKNFRQLNSKTAGHPEWGECPGVETTTGPLGQGLANAVGMAIGEKILNSRFGNELVDHKVYVIAGDGCLMEGISQEAITLAGHLRLNKLVVFFDSNGISIDGKTTLTTSENHQARFEANGWKVIAIDGHDYLQIDQAILEANQSPLPTLIICKTLIGYGSPNKQGSEKAHGSPLGKEEVIATKAKLNWNYPAFEIPPEILETWRKIGKRSLSNYQNWQARLESASCKEGFNNAINRVIPKALEQGLLDFKKKTIVEKSSLATRQSSQKVLEVIAELLPELIGGSADLTSSNLTKVEPQTGLQADKVGNYIYYGIREHGMVAILNGMCLHKGVIPYGGTFLTFTDYARPSIRLAALMKQPTLMVMTHDSIGLGEDGPTHQPVEHLSTLRAIPNLKVYRPCDTIEVAEVWELMIKDENHPAILSLCRQKLPLLRNEQEDNLVNNKSAQGGYEIWNSESSKKIEMVIVATGSEVSLSLEVAQEIAEKYTISVVSVPCMELLLEQEQSYLDKLFPPQAKLVVVEAGIRMSWDWLLKKDDFFFGVESFGKSAPINDVYDYFGLTKNKIIKKLLAGN